MEPLICWRCHEKFTINRNDIRPYVYHECSDGKMAAHTNPNLKRTRRPWKSFRTKTEEEHMKKRAKNYLLEDYFNYSFESKKDEEGEEDE